MIGRIEIGDWYDAGVTEGIKQGEGHFDLASVTLQGAAYGSITPIKGYGVLPSHITVQKATADGEYLLRKPAALYLTHDGNKTYYVAPTGGATGYTRDWYYVDSGGTDYYRANGTATKYTLSTAEYYTVGAGYAGTRLYEADSPITNLRKPGTTDNSTYYTKKATQSEGGSSS